MKITILGCGSSGGVPLIGGSWGVCDPHNSRNRRTRVSIIVESKGQVILVDTSPDLRNQLLDFGLQTLDAVLYTHAHADHCHGIDDLRSINWITQKPIEIYADPTTLGDLSHRFPYIFEHSHTHGYGRPSVATHAITGPFSIGDVEIIPFEQNHGTVTSQGFRFGDFAYSTDVHMLDEAAFDILQGIKVWLVDCVRPEPHPTHSHISQTLEWIAKIKPEQAFLTHMNHMMDYETLCQTLPKGVLPAYDGLVVTC